MENPQDFNTPTIFTIFGATGDLSKKKLFPALCRLYAEGFLPDEYFILGFSKEEIDDEEFRDMVKSSISENESLSKDEIEEFLSRAYYESGLFQEVEDYEKLNERVNSLEEEIGTCANKLYYLAVPQRFYDTIFENLSDSGLMDPCSEEEGWSRVLVEKPFGRSLQEAKNLDKTLKELFKEEQIFRIDHYLNKEVIQNILTFRFSNTLFDSSWDHESIERVEVRMLEDFGVEDRGGFYDDIGALRDVGQNHVLQMMAMVGMEHPGGMSADQIRPARADFFDNLEPIPEDEIGERVTLGQYKGYRKIEGVKGDSDTETYFRIKASVDNERWSGVPFYLESGKSLDKTEARINIYFEPCTDCLCPPEFKCGGHQNVLTFNIKPEKNIEILFWAKEPGFTMKLEERLLSFDLKEVGLGGEHRHSAYESVLFECIVGDQTSFVSSEEKINSWEFMMSILNNKDKIKLKKYPPGSRPNGGS